MSTAPGGSALDHMTAELSPSQRRAVEHRGTPLVVLAGPGSGKTRVLAARMASLLDPSGDAAVPESILALAFTKASAEELRERMAGLVGPSVAQRIGISTSHAFGWRVVQRFADVLELPAGATLMDSAQRRLLLMECIAASRNAPSEHADGPGALIEKLGAFIKQCETEGLTPADVEAWLSSPPAPTGDAVEDEAHAALQREIAILNTLHAAFRAERLRRGWLTFDDYINLPVEILTEHSGPAAIVRQECRHILVDEFQDWNPAQILMLEALAPPESAARDICVVGDDDQSIYAFRGADDRAFERFAQIWSDHETITLETNYRSAPPIVEAGAAIIARAEDRFEPDKIIRPDPNRPTDATQAVELVDHPRGLAEGPIAAALILLDRAESGRSWKDMAVITRSNTQADRVAAALELEDIPVSRRRTPAPEDDEAVRDLFSWMRALSRSDADADVQRLLLRPPFQISSEAAQDVRQRVREVRRERRASSTIAALAQIEAPPEGLTRFLQAYAALEEETRTLRAGAAVRAIIHAFDLSRFEFPPGPRRARREQDLLRVVAFADAVEQRLSGRRDIAALLRHHKALDEADRRSLLMPSLDQLDGADDDADAGDAVSVITAHQAKGSEFKAVFVTDVFPPHGFPSTRERAGVGVTLPESLIGRAHSARLDEERRLFYVACTRAESRLVLIAPRSKSRSKSTHFFHELSIDADGPQHPVVDAETYLERAEIHAGTAETPERGVMTESARLEHAAVKSRRRAAQALHSLERAEVSRAELEAAQDILRVESARLAGIAYMRGHGEPPPECDPDVVEFLDSLRLTPPPGPFERGFEPPITLSFTDISLFDDCPRCYCAKQRLGASEPPGDPIMLGSIMHDALFRFYKRWRDADAEGAPAPGFDQLRSIADELAARVLSRLEEPEAAHMQGEIAHQLETMWARLHDPNAQILELEWRIPHRFTVDGEAHTVVAKLDRVDLRPDGGRRIIDYKTGRGWKKFLEPAQADLQMGIYALALRSQLEDEDQLCGSAEYWMLSSGEKGTIDLQELKLDKITEKLENVIRALRAGGFERGRNCRRLCTVLLPEGAQQLG